MVLAKILRAGEGKILRRLKGIAEHIDAIEPDFVELTDAELRGKTDEFRARLDDGASLDDILPEAFATVREAAKRTLGQRHYPVQLMGGAAMHLGNVAEMKTGEGKTLVSTLPAYLNALTGKGVHLVTTNDYLAKRDSEWMGRVHHFLGLEVGVILTQMRPDERQRAYAADITYGTNNEFGFDYLRDNMVTTLAECVQRGHHFAIVDEADSILIDEARTPLIISGPAEHSARWYSEFARIAPLMKRDVHYEVDEAKRTVGISEEGVAVIEDQLGIDNLYEAVNTPLVGYVNNALRAKELYRKDKDYIVTRGEVLIVDEHTGRVLEGRRYNEGLHQAIEAKEGVEIKQEFQTLATVTLQNYFRLYDKLGGMTGTAQTEAAELHQIYKMGVVPIPTNKPMVRADRSDVVYMNEKAKFSAVVEDIAGRHEAGQPVLVGTASVEKSELVSALLLRRGIPHEVLNAKYHEKEATIVARAGTKAAVTVSTNMAGRGTDIILGGNFELLADLKLREQGLSPVETPEEYEAAWSAAVEEARKRAETEGEEIRDLGGLYVLGTERHESRRIDNQLRGRCGRQGDPGETRFYLSLADDLMQRFNASAVEAIMYRLNMPEDEPIESKTVSRAIKSAQTQVEQQNFEIRKNVLKYDEVLNRQREVIYGERRKILEGADLREQILSMIDDVVTAYVEGATGDGYPEDWDLEQLWTALRTLYPVSFTLEEIVAEAGGEVGDLSQEFLVERIREDALAAYQSREEQLGAEALRELERGVLLTVLDRKWREHLYEMDYLQEGIGLRALGQRDPLVEYKREGFGMFSAMMDAIREESVGYLFNLQVQVQQPEEDLISSGFLVERKSAAEVAGEPAAVATEGTAVGDSGGAAGGGAAGGGTTGEPERGAAPKISAKGLQRQGLGSGLRYSAPTLDPAGAEDGGDSGRSATQTAEPGRNTPCPCGSGKKYKRCHGAPQNR